MVKYAMLWDTKNSSRLVPSKVQITESKVVKRNLYTMI